MIVARILEKLNIDRLIFMFFYSMNFLLKFLLSQLLFDFYSKLFLRGNWEIIKRDCSKNKGIKINFIKTGLRIGLLGFALPVAYLLTLW